MVYFVFCGLWTNAFLSAVIQFIVASAAVIWYFKQERATMPITRSIYRAFRYHLGSLAFGSFILAVLQMLQLIMLYVEKLAKSSGNQNKLIVCVIKYFQCYLACLERLVEFINRNAYIQIAIGGKNFCGAVKDAFSVISSNALRFAAVSGLGAIFNFIGVCNVFN